MKIPLQSAHSDDTKSATIRMISIRERINHSTFLIFELKVSELIGIHSCQTHSLEQNLRKYTGLILIKHDKRDELPRDWKD